MTDTVKHMPAPWFCNGKAIMAGKSISDQKPVGSFIKAQDGAYIVQACNAHGALVEALMELINEVEHGDADGVIAAVDKGYSALKLAGAA